MATTIDGPEVLPSIDPHERKERVRDIKVKPDVSEVETDVQDARCSCCHGSVIQRIGSTVSHALETFYYKLGYATASRPWTVILLCFLISTACGMGMIRFEKKDSSGSIWVPEDSAVMTHQRWVEKTFPLKVRFNQMIVTADNILRPDVLQEMLVIDTMVKELFEYNNTENSVYNFNWTSICIRLVNHCWSNSILELWSFNTSLINNLKSTNEIASVLEAMKFSPLYYNEYNAEEWLGDVTYDGTGRPIAAKAAKMLYVIKATSEDELNVNLAAADLLWEKKFIALGRKLQSREGNVIKTVNVGAVRSFRDESDQSWLSDMVLLMAGVFIIIAYVAVVLGKFNEVEHKVFLALAGVFGIGLSSLVCYGLASAMGMFYGPIHPILPFMLIGLGVDDMFVIIEAWNNLLPLEKHKELPVRIATAMKHAGVSVTVTSLTDLVAFSIGATTALPALRSFCVFAAIGIFSLFLMQSTFFVACLTIDARRQDKSRDACCIWIKYDDFEPNTCSEKQFLPWVLRDVVAPNLVKDPAKAMVMTLVVGLLVVTGYGTYKLKTDSDLAWFLPTDSYFFSFLQTQDRFFNDGTHANLFVGDINYFKDHKQLEEMTAALRDSELIQKDSLSNWHSSYLDWLKMDQTVQAAKDLQKINISEGYPQRETEYYILLRWFVSEQGMRFYENLKWNDSNPQNYWTLEASKISFKVKVMESSKEEVEALDKFTALCNHHMPGKAFVYSPMFRNWETNRVIQRELFSNLGMAFAAVLIVTLLLVANIWVCLLVCLCVVITLVNVCGCLHFWGLTIDTLTSILLILSIGLAIDYSAHIGHTFMTVGGSKNDRARITIMTIGTAVIHGGFSTFLAVVLLATSNSYVFLTFFKVFFLVVFFGLFNGLCFLPVLLSWVGPQPYLNAKKVELTSNQSINLKELSLLDTTKMRDLSMLTQSKKGIANQQKTSTEKVESYIHSLPDTVQLVELVSENLLHPGMPDHCHIETGSNGSAQRNDGDSELDHLLTDLEDRCWSERPNELKHKALVHRVIDDQHLYRECEQYLSAPSQSGNVNHQTV